MEIIRKQSEDLNLYVDVKVLHNDVLPLVEKELKKIRREQNFPGFRQGNAPMSLITKKFGKSVWWEETSKYAVKSVEDYLESEKIEVFGYPILADDFSLSVENIENTEEMIFPFFVGMKPTIDDSNLYNTKLTKYNILVSEKEIENVIDGYKRNFGSFQAVDKSNIDSFLKIELTQNDENHNVIENPIHIESTSILVKYISEEKQNDFIGITTNDEIYTDIKNLFKNPSELASILKIDKEEIEKAEKLFFRIKILEVKNFVAAELNEELYKKCFPEGTIKTEEEFKARVKEDIERTYKIESNNILKQEIREEISKQSETIISLPEKFLKSFLNRRTAEEAKEAKEMSEEELKANYDFLRWDSFCGKIMKENNIEISDKDIFNEAKADVVQYIIQQYGQNFFPEETIEKYAKDFLANQGMRTEIQFRLRDNKVLDAIIDKFPVEQKEVSVDEMNAILKEKYPNPNEANTETQE